VTDEQKEQLRAWLRSSPVKLDDANVTHLVASFNHWFPIFVRSYNARRAQERAK
jgi:hypothetical protein